MSRRPPNRPAAFQPVDVSQFLPPPDSVPTDAPGPEIPALPVDEPGERVGGIPFMPERELIEGGVPGLPVYTGPDPSPPSAPRADPMPAPPAEPVVPPAASSSPAAGGSPPAQPARGPVAQPVPQKHPIAMVGDKVFVRCGGPLGRIRQGWVSEIQHGSVINAHVLVPNPRHPVEFMVGLQPHTLRDRIPNANLWAASMKDWR